MLTNVIYVNMKLTQLKTIEGVQMISTKHYKYFMNVLFIS